LEKFALETRETQESVRRIIERPFHMLVDRVVNAVSEGRRENIAYTRLTELELSRVFQAALEASAQTLENQTIQNLDTHSANTSEDEEWEQLPEQNISDIENEEDEMVLTRLNRLQTELINDQEHEIDRMAPMPVKTERVVSSASNEPLYRMFAGECMDFSEADVTQISAYLAADQDHLVILGPGDGIVRFASAVCSSKQAMKQNLKNSTSLALPCVGRRENGDADWPATRASTLVKINLSTWIAWVPYNDVNTMIESDEILWQIVPNDQIVEATASARAVLTMDWISADHCQSGTSKLIHRLQPIRLIAEPNQSGPIRRGRRRHTQTASSYQAAYDARASRRNE
jgi:hypothetical protein